MLRLDLENIHLILVLILLAVCFLLKPETLSGIALASVAFQIYLRMLKFSFVILKIISKSVFIIAISRAVFTAFLLFILVKHYNLGVLDISVAALALILSLVLYGFSKNIVKG